MNGRVCQLCGKPLSRIWASGGDFCSREHRNQYRLRCGMDTLLEASKHASLMRRRDQLRQFPSSQLQSKANIDPRPFAPLPMAPRRPSGPGLKDNAVLQSLSLQAVKNDLRPLTAAPLDVRATLPRVVALPARSSRRLAAFPGMSLRLRAALAPAGLTAIQFKHAGGAGFRRSFVMLSHPARRVLITKQAFRRLARGPVLHLPGKRARGLQFAAQVGKALRVSGNAGFRLPALAMRPPGIRAVVSGAIQWPAILPLSRLPYQAAETVADPAKMEFPAGAVRPPASHRKGPIIGLPRAAARRLVLPSCEDAEDHRPEGWRSLALDRAPVMTDPGLRTRRSSAPPVFRKLRPAPAAGSALARAEQARFEAQDHAIVSMLYPWNSSR